MEKRITEKEDIRKIRLELKKEHKKLKIRKFCKNKSAMIGGSITILMILLAVISPIFAADPVEIDMVSRLLSPGISHWFGTDNFGRDLFSRVTNGARISIGVGAVVCILTLAFGMITGLLAGYYSRLDNLLMRICDGLKAIPNLLLAIALMAVLGASVRNVIIALVVVHTPDIARITRSAALVVKEQIYIEAMRALGAKPGLIILRHIAPNVLSPVIVQISFIFAKAIVIEASLSFLGAGVPAPAPSWGNILADGKELIYNAPWMVVFPGVFMALTVLGLNLFGDGLRDVLDPMTN
ncbi:ABC transporter permease [Lachnospiraceae bacterium 54-53]